MGDSLVGGMPDSPFQVRQPVTKSVGTSREASSEEILASYRRLAEVFHDVLSEQSLDALLDRIADTLADLVPYDSLTVYRAEEAERMLVPVMARDRWAEEILSDSVPLRIRTDGLGRRARGGGARKPGSARSESQRGTRNPR